MCLSAVGTPTCYSAAIVLWHYCAGQLRSDRDMLDRKLQFPLEFKIQLCMELSSSGCFIWQWCLRTAIDCAPRTQCFQFNLNTHHEQRQEN